MTFSRDDAERATAGRNVPSGNPVLFDAVLRPHRSLSPFGFAVLMAAACLAGFAGGIAFVLAGAWPVFGFGILELGLFYGMFRLNYRSARMFERLLLTADRLTVERHATRGGIERWRFQPYWLSIDIDDPPEHGSPLHLTSHGRSLAIGAFLTPGERGELARALRSALSAARASPTA